MSKLPDIKTNFSDWYNEIIYQAELADQSPVRGCIVIRPYGYALWENIRDVLDKKIKDTGHQNASFPLFIPESFLKKEASHVEGFSPELAVVTHAGGKELAEPLVVRPTSETIIHFMFAKWLKSYRDLPIKINQWANVVRWEMRTRPFLRTTEFFWQEGHTAHATKEEAEHEARTMLAEYIDLAHNYLAIPAVPGQKSTGEKFPGADMTLTFEALMQDGKALQMGTSHMISQSFAHAFDMKYQDKDGNMAYPHLTSWGATTRLIGAVVMVHGDSKGLVLPPRVAPVQVVIVPIYKSEQDIQIVKDAVARLEQSLRGKVRVLVDDEENKTPGNKFFKWELRGVPLRVEIGPRDLANNQVVVVDRLDSKKQMLSIDTLDTVIPQMLNTIQQEMLARAQQRQQAMWYKASTIAEIMKDIDNKPGFYQTGWCDESPCETVLKEYKATIRCLLPNKEFTLCYNCGKTSKTDILVAKAY